MTKVKFSYLNKVNSDAESNYRDNISAVFAVVIVLFYKFIINIFFEKILFC